MEALFASALRALRSLFTPGMFGIMVVTVIVTIAALTGFVGIATAFFVHIAAQAHYEWLAWLGGAGATLLAWFLFPGIMPVIANFFGDRIASIIEKQEYTAIRPARQNPFLPEFLHDAGFVLVTILLNILVLPFYLLPIINIFLFYLLNGYLLGREFFVMVGRRHITTEQAEKLRKEHSRSVTATGIVLTFLATVPVVNLLAPFWGIAAMTHLYHRLAKTPAAPEMMLPR